MSFKVTADNIHGPILALDLGKKRVGVAVSDELLISVRRLGQLKRASWKQLVADVTGLVRRFDAKIVVIGLPLRMDEKEGTAATEVADQARKLAQSLDIPVHLQDEKLTSIEARERLESEGLDGDAIRRSLDSEAAAIILQDFITSLERGDHFTKNNA